MTQSDETEPLTLKQAGPNLLTRTQLYMLSAAAAVVTANAYYVHPIIASVAGDFGVSATRIGMVPAFNQLALALGIFFLLPLGDRYSNRRLTSIFVAGQFVAIAAMAFAQNFGVFVACSTVLGFFTIAPYLLPAYVSRRVLPTDLGRSTAVLTTGIIAGILIARAGAGFMGEYLGWRSVYFVAAALMLIISLILPLIMEEREPVPGPKISYPSLLKSMFPVVRSHPEILLSGAIQALGFGIFLAIWMGLGLHLTSAEMGYGTDVVGYLAIFSILNLLTTPRFGSWADRTGARKARLIISIVQFGGVCLFLPFGNSLWLLCIPIALTNLVGPIIDITGRMTFLSAAPEVRTRLMTVYIGMMFTGGGIASWASTAIYDRAGWTGNSLLALFLSALVVSLCYVGLKWKGNEPS